MNNFFEIPPIKFNTLNGLNKELSYQKKEGMIDIYRFLWRILFVLRTLKCIEFLKLANKFDFLVISGVDVHIVDIVFLVVFVKGYMILPFLPG